MLTIEMVASQLVFILALATLTSIVILTLASQFGRYTYLELTTHFRLQYLLAAIACALVLTPLQSWRFVLVALFCALLNAAYLRPYYRFTSSTPKSPGSKRLTLLHTNVFEKNTNYQAVLNLVNDSNADLVVLQELTEDWSKQTATLQRKYPYSEIAPRADGAGMALYSRHPLENVQVLNLDSSAHIAIFARVNVGETALFVLALHPPTPMTPAKFENRNRQFREAAILLNSIDGPKVLVGDLNTTMWSPYFGSLVRDAGLRDARLEFGLKTSWPLPLPSFLRLPIDHCLISDDVGVDQVQVGAHIGSDHKPLVVELRIK